MKSRGWVWTMRPRLTAGPVTRRTWPRPMEGSAATRIRRNSKLLFESRLLHRVLPGEFSQRLLCAATQAPCGPFCGPCFYRFGAATPPVVDVNDYMLRETYFDLCKTSTVLSMPIWLLMLTARMPGTPLSTRSAIPLRTPTFAAENVYCNGPFLGTDYAAILRNYQRCKALNCTISGVFD